VLSPSLEKSKKDEERELDTILSINGRNPYCENYNNVNIFKMNMKHRYVVVVENKA
jgi:hypothetical protein